MNKILKVSALLLTLVTLLSCFAGCRNEALPDEGKNDKQIEFVDYASIIQLNKNSFTAKLEVTVKNFVDGDTVHFNVPTSVMPEGVLKARFLAINTPESTGKI